MPIFDHTQDDLVEMTCKLLLHDWVGGTTSAAGSSSTAKDAARQEEDDFFNSKGSYIYIRDGTYAGTYSKITDFAVATGVGTITFAPVADGTIASGVQYSIHTDFPRHEVVDAINLAIDRVAEEAMFWKIDETSITLVAAQYEYDLPTDYMFLNRVTMANSDGDFYDAPIDTSQYKIIYGATPKLHFIGMPKGLKYEGHEWGSFWRDTDLTADRKLRLEGMGSQARLANDADTCAIDPNYIIHQAAAILFLSRARGTEADPDDNRTRGTICQGLANQERERIVKVQLPPDSKRVRE